MFIYTNVEQVAIIILQDSHCINCIQFIINNIVVIMLKGKKWYSYTFQRHTIMFLNVYDTKKYAIPDCKKSINHQAITFGPFYLKYQYTVQSAHIWNLK